MKALFFGTSAFAVPSLERLARSRHTIVMCVTQPDRPQGRGLRMDASPVKAAALRLGVPLSQPERPTRRLFEALHPDVGVVIAYGRLLTREMLALPRFGMLGVHPSLLPKSRGAAPIARALMDGETTTGVTIFRLNERLDAGPILSQRAIPLGATETAETLSERLADLGAEELLAVLEALEAGRATATPQDETQASLAPKLTKAEGLIDWRQPADRLACLVRGAAPWPGAATTWGETSLKIWSASAIDAVNPASPGTVVGLEPEAIVVAAGRGALRVTELQPAGRRRMTAREFLAGHPMRLGETLGDA